VKVLITGITGILGQYLIRTKPRDVVVTGISRTKCEQTSPNVNYVCLPTLDIGSLTALVTRIRPDVLIHAAAEGSVDAVEANPLKYKYVNQTLPGQLAKLTKEHSIQYVYLSSNAVYGDQLFPWTEESAQFPVNIYGTLKANAELNVFDANSSALIVRPIIMYGWPLETKRDNPVSFWIRQLSSGKSVSVVSDVRTQPLYAGDCAKIMWTSIRREIHGSLNISGGSTLSLFDFARLSASVFDFNPKSVLEISSQDLQGLAPRPTLTEFDLSKLNSIVGNPPRDPTAGLIRMKNEVR
jgi:dTDP-4-dehydrorhamnose reductase